jgi:hypothetical protein
VCLCLGLPQGLTATVVNLLLLLLLLLILYWLFSHNPVCCLLLTSWLFTHHRVCCRLLSLRGMAPAACCVPSADSAPAGVPQPRPALRIDGSVANLLLFLLLPLLLSLPWLVTHHRVCCLLPGCCCCFAQEPPLHIHTSSRVLPAAKLGWYGTGCMLRAQR